MSPDDPSASVKYAVGWASFGAAAAMLATEGTGLNDLHQENIGYRKNGFQPLFFDGVAGEPLKYPDEWELLPIGLMSLLSWLPIDMAAAFRFGYLQRGGPIGEAVFARLRTHHGVNAFTDETQFRYEPYEEKLMNLEELFSRDEAWHSSIKSFPLGTLIPAGNKYSLDDLKEWLSVRDKYGNRRTADIDEYHYRKHLVCAWFHGDPLAFIEALLALAALYSFSDRPFLAYGVARYLHVASRKHAIPDLSRQMINEYSDPTRYRLSESDTAKIYLLDDIADLFLHLWALDDCAAGEVNVSGDSPN